MKPIVEQPIQLTMFNEVPLDPTPTPHLEEIVVPESIVTEETMIKRTEEPVEEERKIIPFNNGDWDEEDPFPQYMTKAETEEVLERWWSRRNGITK